MIPQILIIGLFIVEIFYGILMHGKPRKGKHNIVVTLLTWSTFVIILIAGGFFNYK